MKNEPELVYCELHHGYVESWEAYYVKEADMKIHRVADGSTLQEDEYGACHDCLADELHPLVDYNYEEYL